MTRLTLHLIAFVIAVGVGLRAGWTWAALVVVIDVYLDVYMLALVDRVRGDGVRELPTPSLEGGEDQRRVRMRIPRTAKA
jgi:hypothetical protein